MMRGFMLLAISLAWFLGGCGTTSRPLAEPPAAATPAAPAKPAPSAGPDPGGFLDPLSGRRLDASLDETSKEEAKRIDAVRRLYRDGLYDQARVGADRLLADGIAHPELLQLKAELLAQAGDSEGAVVWAQKAVDRSPRWVDPRILMARSYLALGRHAAADAVFADLERLYVDGPWGAYGRGLVASIQGDHQAAARWYDKALGKNHDHVPSLLGRARTARVLGETARERDCLARVVEQDPSNLGARLRLADLALAAGRLDDARSLLAAAYELAPQSELAGRLADLAQQRGDAEDAALWRARAGNDQKAPLDDIPLPIH
jgi:tetratricopeptide (TPR) repeat protein